MAELTVGNPTPMIYLFLSFIPTGKYGISGKQEQTMIAKQEETLFPNFHVRDNRFHSFSISKNNRGNIFVLLYLERVIVPIISTHNFYFTFLLFICQLVDYLTNQSNNIFGLLKSRDEKDLCHHSQHQQ